MRLFTPAALNALPGMPFPFPGGGVGKDARYIAERTTERERKAVDAGRILIPI